MKKQSCRMTAQEKETHKQAGRYRRMTDAQLMEFIRSKEQETEKWKTKAYVLAAEVEEIRKSIVANEDGANSAEKEKVIESSTESQKRPEIEIRGVVARLIDSIMEYDHKGYGIGCGTVRRLHRILADTTDEQLGNLVFSDGGRTDGNVE